MIAPFVCACLALSEVIRIRWDSGVCSKCVSTVDDEVREAKPINDIDLTLTSKGSKGLACVHLSGYFHDQISSADPNTPLKELKFRFVSQRQQPVDCDISLVFPVSKQFSLT